MSWSRRKFIRAAAVLGLAGSATQARDAAPIRRRIPGTRETLAPVGIGTNRYRVGTAENNAQLRKTLASFVANGGEVIDTAPRYRTSEEILGRLIAELGVRDELFLATKFNLDERNGGEEQMRASQEKLGTDSIDLMQSHNLSGVKSMLPVMREWKEAGRLRYIGITTSRTGQFDDVMKLLKKEPLDFLQINYSLADREAAKRALPLAQDKGIAILVNLPFGRGRLFSAVGNRPLPGWAADFDCTSWAQFFLKYVISHPAVTCAIPGTTKPHHAEDNLGAALGRLPTQRERERQEAWFDSL